MGTPLRVLFVEDSEDDVALVVRELERGGYDPVVERVETREAMGAALDRGRWDVVIADFYLPRFTGPAALALLQERGLDLPFIIVSGSVGEDTAVAAMKAGAHDYLMKGSLTRLVAAIERELREAENRRNRRQAERALGEREGFLRAVLENAGEGIIAMDGRGRIESFNPAAERMFGYAAAEVVGTNVVRLLAERQTARGEGVPADLLPAGTGAQARLRETSGRRRDGSIFPMELTVSETLLDDRRLLIAVVRDITQRKQAEEELRRQMERLAALRKINVAITSSLDLRVTLDVLLDNVTAQLLVDAAAVLLFNAHTRELEFSAGRGFRSATIRRTRLRLGEGLAGRAALERRPVHVADLRGSGGSGEGEGLFRQEAFRGYYATPLLAKGAVKGVLELFRRTPLDATPQWCEFVEVLASQAAIAIDNAGLFNELQRSHAELAVAYDATLEGWSRALELRDGETQGHAKRVTEMTVRLARALGMDEADLVHVRRGALLHDIGKMGIPDSILLKPDALTEDERRIMRQHPTYAYQLLSPIGYLGPALDIPYCHHEHWDGSGYPRGLKGEQIPLAARIFAVVDVWDALRSDRPYRPAWPEDRVREHLRRLAGTHLDPRVVEAFLAMRWEHAS